MQIIESKDYEKIKEAVFKYGGVQTSIYNALRSSQSSSPYYNKSTDAYCYIGTEKPNHDVVIVGWDDSYSKDNLTLISRVMEHLSVRTAGEIISGKTASFIFPIMIQTLEHIMLFIRI